MKIDGNQWRSMEIDAPGFIPGWGYLSMIIYEKLGKSMAINGHVFFPGWWYLLMKINEHL